MTEPEPPLRMWTIYESPADHPGKFVVRAFDIVAGNPDPVPLPECAVCETLTEARLQVPELYTYTREGVTYGSAPYCIERSPGDPPHVVETWI